MQLVEFGSSLDLGHQPSVFQYKFGRKMLKHLLQHLPTNYAFRLLLLYYAEFLIMFKTKS